MGTRIEKFGAFVQVDSSVSFGDCDFFKYTGTAGAVWVADFSDVVNYFPVNLKVDVAILKFPYVFRQFCAVFLILFKVICMVIPSFFECTTS